MVGAGVYTTSGFTLTGLGHPYWVIVAWVLAGAISICGAIGYAMLADRLLEDGGEYLYLSRHVHPLAGTVAGLVSMTAGFTGAAAIAALAAARYAGFAVGPLDTPPATNVGMLMGDLTNKLAASGLVIILAAVQSIGPSIGRRSQFVLVALKLLLITAFVLVAIGLADRWHSGWSDVLLPPSDAILAGKLPGIGQWSVAIMWIMFSYIGFNAAIYIAGQSRRVRDVSVAMIASTVLVTLLYIALNAIFVHAAPPNMVRDEPEIAAMVAEHLGGRPLAMAVRGLIAIGLVTSVSSLLMIGPRVYNRMAMDDVLPRSWVDSGDPPRRWLFVQAIAAIVLMWVTDIRELLGFLGMTLTLCSAAAVATVWRPPRPLRSAHPVVRGFAYAASTIYVVVTCVLATIAGYQQPKQIAAMVIVVLVAAAVYGWQRFRNREGRLSS